MGGRRSAHGRSRSNWADTANTVASSSGRPITCTANGNPSAVHPAGTDAAGFPTRFHNVVNPANRCAPNNVDNHEPRVNSPIRNGGRGVTGDNNTSTSSNNPFTRAATRRPYRRDAATTPGE